MKNIVIIFGGESFENDISIITAISAYNSIFDIYKIYPVFVKDDSFLFCKNLQKIENFVKFEKKNFEEVFFSGGALHFYSMFRKPIEIYCALNCCHGGSGENGGLSGVMEIAGIPYTSADVFASAVFMDKELTKLVLTQYGCKVLPYHVYRKGENTLREEKFPIIVKPARLGSSIGISVVKNHSELNHALEHAFTFDTKVITEKALTNYCELNCAAYKQKGEIVVSQVEQVVFDGEYYDFNAKYVEKKTKRILPATIGEEITNEIRQTTEKIYRLSESKGVIRVDYLYSDSVLYVNEVNTIPGSLAFYLFKGQGGMHRLLSKLIEEGHDSLTKPSYSMDNGEFLKNFDINSLWLGVKK